MSYRGKKLLVDGKDGPTDQRTDGRTQRLVDILAALMDASNKIRLFMAQYIRCREFTSNLEVLKNIALIVSIYKDLGRRQTMRRTPL